MGISFLQVIVTVSVSGVNLFNYCYFFANNKMDLFENLLAYRIGF